MVERGELIAAVVSDRLAGMKYKLIKACDRMRQNSPEYRAKALERQRLKRAKEREARSV